MKFSSYSEFWLFYVSQHMQPATRVWHFTGTSCVFLCLFAAIATQIWWFILLAPVLAYGCAWFSHFTIERNKPATFGHPLWSLRADFQMYFFILTGRMRQEVEKTIANDVFSS